jgi:hypothetical protein
MRCSSRGLGGSRRVELYGIVVISVRIHWIHCCHNSFALLYYHISLSTTRLSSMLAYVQLGNYIFMKNSHGYSSQKRCFASIALYLRPLCIELLVLRVSRRYPHRCLIAYRFPSYTFAVTWTCLH